MADIQYDVEGHKWVIQGGDERPRMEIPDNVVGVFAGWSKFVGTTPLTNVAANALAVATLTGVSNVVAGDRVFANPKAALDAQVGLGEIRVPTTNTIVLRFVTPGATAGSQPAVGWDVFVLK